MTAVVEGATVAPNVEADAAPKPKSKGPPVDENGVPLTGDALVAHHLRAQTRLKGIVKSVEYTNTEDGTGSGVIECNDIGRELPFSCRNISLEKGQLRIAAAGDLCTLKLSNRGHEVRATSIRLKGRRVASTVESPTSAGPAQVAPPQPRAEPAAQAVQQPAGGAAGAQTGGSGAHTLFDGSQPLNAFEYAVAATGLSAGAGSSFGLSPHPAGPPQFPGSMPWSALEPNSMPSSSIPTSTAGFPTPQSGISTATFPGVSGTTNVAANESHE